MQKPVLRIALASPSSPFEPEKLRLAQDEGACLGLKIVGKSKDRPALDFRHGSKAERLAELYEAENYGADAIWCIRGGCGAIELWHDYQPEIFATNTAPLIGYSDTTILHFLRYYRAQRIGIHGPVFLDLRNKSETNLAALRCLIEKRAEHISYPPLKKINNFLPTKVQGELCVMNLLSLQSLVGCFDTSFLRGKILGLEEINEAPYRIFRALQHLKNAGVLMGLKALLIGHLPSERSYIIENIFQPLAGDLGIPLFDWPVFGHDNPNWPLLYGAKVTIRKIDNQLFTLVYDEQHDHTPTLVSSC